MSEEVIKIPIQILALILAVSIHEFSHVFSAYLQGDQTGKLLGRLTLNPLRHLDPLGTMFMVMSVISGVGIGWGKPAPFNPYNLRNRRWGSVLVAVAGPISNILFATIAGYAYITLAPILGPKNLLSLFLAALTIVNAGLAIFNLIPVPPLDGSHFLEAIFGPNNPAVQVLQRYGWALLLFLVIGARGLLGTILFAGIHGILTVVGLGRLF